MLNYIAPPTWGQGSELSSTTRSVQISTANKDNESHDYDGV